MCEIYVRPILKVIRRVKNLHVFVTREEFVRILRVTNTFDFFTREIDSFECEGQTNLSQV